MNDTELLIALARRAGQAIYDDNLPFTVTPTEWEAMATIATPTGWDAAPADVRAAWLHNLRRLSHPIPGSNFWGLPVAVVEEVSA